MAIGDLSATTAQMFGIEYVLSMFVLVLIINSLILWFLTKKFGFRKNDYQFALVVTFITAFVSLFFVFTAPVWMEIWMFPVYFILDVVLIYLIYPASLGDSIKVGLIWWILSAFVSLLLGVVISLVLTIIGITIGIPFFTTWIPG